MFSADVASDSRTSMYGGWDQFDCCCTALPCHPIHVCAVSLLMLNACFFGEIML